MPFIIAVSGLKNSGKTTLCLKLLTLLLEDGVDAAYVKHTHENVLSPGGSDTGLLLEAASRAALWGPDGVRLEESDRKIDSAALAARFFPGRDLLLIEGGKSFPVPRVWVGSPLDIPEEVSGVVAFFDRDVPCAKERHFAAGEEADLAALLASMARGAEASPAEVYCGDKRIPTKAFVGEFISGAVKGMLRSLKGDFDLRSGVSLYLRHRKGEK